MIGEFHNMDCMEGMKAFEDNHFDLAIVDPPYGIKRFQDEARDGKNNRNLLTAKNIKKWDTKPTARYFKELFRISNYQIIWGSNNFNLPDSEYFIAWDKLRYLKNYSEVEIAYTNIKTPAKIFKYVWSGNIYGYSGNITGVGQPSIRIHPTQKPIALYKWLLKNYAKEGDLILDTHVGSASSLIACEDMGFKYVGYELDTDYYNAASKRLQDFVNQLTLF